MRKSTFSIVAAAILLITVTEALSSGMVSFLEWYDDFALRNIWRNMFKYAFMAYVPGIICNMGLQDTIWETLADGLSQDQA